MEADMDMEHELENTWEDMQLQQILEKKGIDKLGTWKNENLYVYMYNMYAWSMHACTCVYICMSANIVW